jgi:serine/threonine protein kinase/WD40 repeat protein
MSAKRDREEELFNIARELAADERPAYLAKSCGQDAELRRRIEGMLEADAAAGEFFKIKVAPPSTGMVADADLSPSIEKAGDRIGRYKLLQQIGEGGMGLVYMAEQDQPVRRSVALKIIKLGMDTRQVVARFEAERQALAMMNHPHIAKVFDAGATDSGRPYFVMELVRGIPITEFCDANCLPTRQRLELFILVCQAVQHAHQKGIIHRDLKPSNILVTLNDGVPWPMIIDFGIAKATHQRLTEKTVFTYFAQMIGTPAYMSPEQAEMSKLDVDTRTDIYALGVLLYELLTGTTPFSTKELLSLGYREMQRTIVEKEPLRLSTRLSTMANEERTVVAKKRSVDVAALAKLFRGDLDWIAMKCLEKDRRRRYETANGLAADLKRHLNNEPVVARPPSTAYQFQKLLRRHKVISAATALVLTVILAGTGISITQTLRAQRGLRRALAAEAQAQREKANAQAAERDAHQQLYAALFEQARATVRSGEMGHRVKALDALRRAAVVSNNVALRREAFAALVLPDLRFERDVSVGQNVTQARCDPAFERIALGRGPRDVEVCSLDSGRLLVSLPASTNLPSHVLMWSDEGRYLMVKRDYPPGGFRSDWEVWDVSAQRRLMLIRGLRGESVAFHPHSNLVVTAHSGAITLRHLESGDEVGRYSTMYEPRRLEISSDGKRFALVHAERNGENVSIFDPDRGAVTASWKCSDFVGDIRWHPSGKWLALAEHSGQVQLLDVETGNVTVLGRHKAEATTLTFSPGGDYLFSGGWDREMICWELQTHQRAFTVGIDSYHLQFSADGRRCTTLVRSPLPPAYFHSLKLHDFERPAAHREFFEDLGNRVEQAAFSPDGRWLAAAGQKRLGVWSLTTKDPGRVVETPLMARLDFTLDGTGLFGSGLRGECLHWRVPAEGDPAVPQLQSLPVIETKGFNSVCVVSNRVIWTGPKGSCIQSLDDAAADAPLIQTSAGLSGASADGRWLGIYRRYSPLLHIYQLPGFEPVARLTNRANILAFRFSPRGDELAVSTRSGVQLWSTKAWTRTREIADFSGILYASDGRTLWLTKDYRTAGLFDARTLEPLLPLPAGMLPLALSSDGRFLAVSVDSRKLQVWDVTEVRRQLRGLGLDWVD